MKSVKRAARWATLLLLALALAPACGTRVPSVGDAGDASDRHDLGADAPWSAPWVETFAGNGACAPSPLPAGATAPRLAMDFLGGPIDVATDAQGRVAVLTSNELWLIEGDVARKLTQGGWDDGAVVAPTVGVGGQAIALGDDGAVYVAEWERLRLVRDGLVSTLAGKKDDPTWVDGTAAEARFQHLLAVHRVPGGFLLGEAVHLRFFDGSAVSTLAGAGTPPMAPPDWKPAKDGPALETPLFSVSALTRLDDGTVRFYSYYRLWSLRDGQLTVDVGYTPLDPSSMTGEFADGPVPKARIGNSVRGLVQRGERLLFSDEKFHALRELTDGVVSTLNDNGALGQPPPRGYRDGPLDQARFDRPMGMALDAQGRLYVADLGNCRIRRITFE